MPSEAKQGLIVEEYLAFERQSETKNEYLDGEIFPMAGTSRLHNLVAGNIFAGLHNQLREGACEPCSDNMRVQTPSSGLFTYPDVVVACGEPKFEDSEFDTLLNPTLIVEVLSPSTEAFDGGIKAGRYRSLPSLSEDLLVAQDRVHVEHFVRQTGERWLLEELSGLGQILELPSIGCRLPPGDIYDRVFPAPSA